MVVLRPLAVIAQQPELRRDLTVVGHDHPAVPVGAEVLRRVEAERRGMAEAADALAFVSRAVRLGGILDHYQVVPCSDGKHGVEIDRLTVQVNRHDRPRSRSDGGRERSRIDRIRLPVHVDQYRLRACRDNCENRGDERVGGGDDLVAGADAVASQRELDGREAGADADRVLGADERGELGLEPFDGGAQDEIAALEDLLNRGLDFAGESSVLRAKVDERDVRACARGHFLSPRPRYTTGRRMLHQSMNGRIFVYPSS